MNGTEYALRISHCSAGQEFFRPTLRPSRFLRRCSGQEKAQLVEALDYKPEGRGFDSRWCRWNFSLTYAYRPHCGSVVDLASNRIEYHGYYLGSKGGRCIGLTNDCLDFWEPQPPGSPWARNRPVKGLPYLLPLPCTSRSFNSSLSSKCSY